MPRGLRLFEIDGRPLGYFGGRGHPLNTCLPDYSRPRVPGIRWQVPVEGGIEKSVSALVRPFTWASWSVVQQGIIFAGPSSDGRPVLGHFDPSTRRMTTVGTLQDVPVLPRRHSRREDRGV